MFTIILLIIFGVIVFGIISAIKKNSYNNAQPVLTVDTKVVAKRTKARGKNTRTYYYVTFEFESGDRVELNMKGNEFGMLVEGDNGQLTFQGGRYLGFKRA
ncbi:DUF2500 domain-containing protein [Clostridium sp.]|uniref:DUF2500 domain-containing protein n=1 Tax=Clostridium sp. TaxID=1506 RepID=UPI003F4C57DF